MNAKNLLVAAFVFLSSNTLFAQHDNNRTDYLGSGLGDHVAISINGGNVTGMSDLFGHNSPIIGVALEKYVTPTIGFAVDFRSALNAPSGQHNPHTVFDAVNASGYLKFNASNTFSYESNRIIDLVPFVGLGWGHTCCSHLPYYPWAGAYEGKKGERNYMTFRSGLEVDFNIKNSNLSFQLVPSVVWGNIRDMRLDKRRGQVEIMGGIVYHFRHRGFRKHVCQAQFVPDPQPAPQKPIIVKVTEKVTSEIEVPKELTYIVQFEYDKDEVVDSLQYFKPEVIKLPVHVQAFASPEGTKKYNMDLSERRAIAVKNWLESHGVTVTNYAGRGEYSKVSNRIAIITLIPYEEPVIECDCDE